MSTSVKLTNLRYDDGSFSSLPMLVIHYLHINMTSYNREKFKTIVIDKQTYQSLRNLGFTGESFNTVVGRLVKLAEKQDK